MSVLVQASSAFPSPESLAASVRDSVGSVLLRTGSFGRTHERYSLVTARPLLTLRSWGARIEMVPTRGPCETRFGNPWKVMAERMDGYEVLDGVDMPFPLGGCFGFWGYDLKQFLEPGLPRRAVQDEEWPDCHLGFFGSLVVFDHLLNCAWVVATGLSSDGSRTLERARADANWWQSRLVEAEQQEVLEPPTSGFLHSTDLESTFGRQQFLVAVERAQTYIRAGDIYQVNLAQRLSASCPKGGWWLYNQLGMHSPAPYSAFIDAGDFELVSSSPELFLRLSGQQMITRPIKGTRPRSSDPTLDAQLGYELQNSSKENSELVMITDLLRNDLGRVCQFGSIHVTELARLERFAQVQHLVSTIEGRLRPEYSHLDALTACFPGGSITGAPKIRAMEIIDELEPVTRGPYCGCHGYMGFNRESQLGITIRTALVREGRAWFSVGAGIVADSNPLSEYEETLAKAQGWISAMEMPEPRRGIPQSKAP